MPAVIETTETHEIDRLGGKLTVEITYTPRTGAPIRMHRLAMRVTAADGCSPYVFVYRRATDGAPMEDGSPRDEFMCVADELNEDELPTEAQGPDIEHGIPYYRADSVELLFRSSDAMYETAHSIMRGLVA